MACEYPACRKGWVNVNDIEDEIYVRFIEAAGCHNLDLGALLRGLGQVTEKRDRSGKGLHWQAMLHDRLPSPRSGRRRGRTRRRREEAA